MNQCWNIVSWTFVNKLQWSLHRNKKLFIHENALENVVCEMVAILSRSCQGLDLCGSFLISGLLFVISSKSKHPCVTTYSAVIDNLPRPLAQANGKKLSRGIWAITHDDVIKWKHFWRCWPFVPGIHWSTVKSPHKGQWHRALIFSLISAWINGWVNNREAGHFRCHCTHYNVVVMW